LIFYRVVDHPADVGIQWGMFVAFVVAGVLAYAGQRMHAAGRPASVRERRPSRRGTPDPSEDATELVAWSDEPTAVARVERRRRRSAAIQDAEIVEPARKARPPAARADPPPTAPRPPDRAVRREDARVTVDDPPDAPLDSREVPRGRDRD